MLTRMVGLYTQSPLGMAVVVLFMVFGNGCAIASAQLPVIASPGDSPTDAGPLARNLSKRFAGRDIKRAIQLVGNWQLRRLPDAPQTDWTFAALYIGLMSVPPNIAGDRYKQAVIENAKSNRWELGPRLTHADDQAIGQSYVELYMLDREPAMLEPVRSSIDEAMATPSQEKRPLWWWADALFMSPPLYAELASATGNPLYLDYMDKQWDVTSNLLYDPNKHLFSRDSTYLQKQEANGQKLFWSRGNGWVMAGLVRVLRQLPKGSPHRAKYVRQLQEMANAVVPLQGADGLWKPGLLDSASYQLPEVSGSAFITYAIAYGVNEKILDRKKFLPVLHHAWSGMLSHIYADGRLGCIQPVGAAPGKYTETASYVYGIGAFLLAGSEIYRLSNN